MLFNDDFTIRRAAWIPTEILEQTARYAEHVNGHLVFATDDLLDRGTDWTKRLQAAVL